MEIKPNNIYLGNSYELIKNIPDKSIDLIITDPPYDFSTDGLNTGLFKDRLSKGTYEEIRNNGIDKGIDLSILNDFVRVMKKINIYIWCNKEQIYDYLTFFVKERKCNWEMLIWAKDNPPPFLNGHYLKDKEYCLYFWEQGVKLKPSYENGKTVFFSKINIEDKKKYGHPTIKPIEIIKALIENSTGGGAIILDTFMGSGTTCVACKELCRQYIGIEINPNYYQIAKDRLNGINQKGQTDLFNTDFEQLSLLESEEDK